MMSQSRLDDLYDRLTSRKSAQVWPAVAFDEAADVCLRDAIFPCKRGLDAGAAIGGASLSDLLHLCVGQLGAVVRHSAPRRQVREGDGARSAFGCAVSIVVTQRTEAEMVRPDTSAHIAAMQNGHTDRDVPEVKSPRDPMRSYGPPIDTNQPVPLGEQAGSPHPARAEFRCMTRDGTVFVDPVPEPPSQIIRTLSHLLTSRPYCTLLRAS